MFAVVCLINGNANPLAVRVTVLCTICTEGRHVEITTLPVRVL